MRRIALRVMVALLVSVPICAINVKNVKADTIVFSGGAGGQFSVPSVIGGIFKIDPPISSVTREPLGLSDSLRGANLNFQSGPITSIVTDATGTTTYTFGTGGIVTISQKSCTTCTPVTLLSATFVTDTFSYSGSTGSFSGLLAVSYVDASLLTALGFPDSVSFAGSGTDFEWLSNIHLSKSGKGLTGWVTSSTVTSPAVIPEAPPLVLLGTGLTALALVLKKLQNI